MRDPPLGTVIFTTINKVGTDLKEYLFYPDSRWKIWKTGTQEQIEARPPIGIMAKLIYEQIVHERRIAKCFWRKTGEKDVDLWCDEFRKAIDDGLNADIWVNIPSIYLEQIHITERLRDEHFCAVLRQWCEVTVGYRMSDEELAERRGCYTQDEPKISGAATVGFSGVPSDVRTYQTILLSVEEDAANTVG